MRKFSGFIAALCLFSLSSFAQKAADSTRKTVAKTDWSKIKLTDRANDHFMIQFGYDNWASKPDSIATTGFSRHFNAYVMYDIPFKTDARLSVAIGAGLGTSSIFFEKTNVNIIGSTGKNVALFNTATGNYFKKYKLNTTYMEAPVELRYVKNPLASSKSFKASVGVKIGSLIEAHTKGKNLVSQSGSSVYGAKYVNKEKEKRFFNTTRLAATARVGIGAFTLYGSYQINTLFKEGFGPNIRPYSIGLCIGGL